MTELDDWAQYVMWAEKNLKEIDDKLLHRKYDGIEVNAKNVEHALAKIQEWVQRHSEQ